MTVLLAGLLPVLTAPAPAFLARPGLAVADTFEAKFRRGTAGEAAATLPPRPFTATGPLLLPLPCAAADGGDVLLAGVAGGCCCFSDLFEALEGVRLNGSRLGGEAAGFLVRPAAAAAGGVRLAEGSLAEN